MTVAKLTQEQAEKLKGVEVVKGNLFNPILDANGNYIISLEEAEQCNIDWVKKLPTIEFNPIIETLETK